MSYAVLGETTSGQLFTQYETGISGGHVLQNGEAVETSLIEAARTVSIHQSGGTITALEEIRSGATGFSSSGPTAVIIAGKLFQVGQPVGGIVVDPAVFEQSKPLLQQAAENLRAASWSDVSFTELPKAAIASAAFTAAGPRQLKV